MPSVFVDTDVFLRFLTNDDPVKAKRVETLFRNAVRGRITLTTSLLVVATSLPIVTMPNREGFIPDPRPDAR